MAELKNTRYIVKHIDGVMHLIQANQGNVPQEAITRLAAQAVETTEQKK